MSSIQPMFAPPSARTDPHHLRRWIRDLAMVLGSILGLCVLMTYHGDVVHPHGEDLSHPLGHYASLTHSGHIPGAVLFGAALVALAILGILGLLGDSPLDLRGDEIAARHAARRRIWKSEGFWLIAICTVLYVPLAGAYGLWDPWETHYAEVSREILARDDWITLWWGQEGWFLSKPVLIFWIEALSMDLGSVFGISFWSDHAPGAHEWFIRLPIILFAIAAVYALYRAVARACGRRAGLLSGLVLATCPYWFLIAHQGMTDMPFVAPLTIAMSFLMVAVSTDSNELVSPRQIRLLGRTFRFSAWHLAVAAIVTVALPQILYLITRPAVVRCGPDSATTCEGALRAARLGPIQLPIDSFASGSAGNSAWFDAASSVPGSPAWEIRFSSFPIASVLQGIFWAALGVILLWSLRRERRRQALCFAMMYLFGALSFLAKGPAGLGVLEIVLAAFIITRKRWDLIRRLRLLQGLGIFLLCGAPWYLAIYSRLGSEYTDRFVINDLLNRALVGVHGDTGTFRYFVWQLGYGLFPWSGLAPAAILGWRTLSRDSVSAARKDVLRIVFFWFLFTFALFSFMVTKFHHYILPAVPAVAILIGVVVDKLLAEGAIVPSARASIGLVAGMASWILGCARWFGSWSAQVEGSSNTPSHPLAIALVLFAVVLLIDSYRTSAAAAQSPTRDPSLAAVGIAATVVIALVARDLSHTGSLRPAGYEHLAHLFTYNYQRNFPTKTLDHHAMLTGFAIAAILCTALLMFNRIQQHASRMLLVLAVLFSAWALDRYLIDLSHHWSQRDLFARYYHERAEHDAPAPLAAYAMNWKGENFYTGNHAAMLECGLPLCAMSLAEWIGSRHGERVFVVTEHGREAAVATTAVGRVHGHARTLTDDRDNVMFVLIEAQL